MDRTEVMDRANVLYDSIFNKLAETLKAKRKSKGLTVLGLAKLAGVSTTVICDVENKVSFPRAWVIIRLFVALEITLQELAGVEVDTGILKENAYSNLEEALSKLTLGKNEVQEIINYTKYKEDTKRRS